jgi:hypothetical protein
MTPEEFVKAFEEFGSIKAVARATGTTYGSVRKVYLQAVAEGIMEPQSVGRKSTRKRAADVEPTLPGFEPEEDEPAEPVFHGTRRAPRALTWQRGKIGEVKRYILTSAQNNTNLHTQLLQNLEVFAAYHDADILVGRYTYQKSGLNSGGDKADFMSGAKKETLYGADTIAWAPEIEEYVTDERVQLAPGLVWCGEWQRSPTTKRPLTGFETYTGRNSGIFPHSKFEMQSVASAKNEPAKFNYTTGTVTMRNYIVKGAGLQATFHHGYGALLVEVDDTGAWWVRQLNADSDGTFYDLDLRVKDGKITGGHRPVGVTFGDLHHAELDPVIDEVNDHILGTLSPMNAFYHDLLSFVSRNHHETKDPFAKYYRHVNGQGDVREEVWGAMQYLGGKAERFGSTHHVVVDSNHDRALERWLRESDWREDPLNMEFFMEAALAKIKAMKEDVPFHMLRHWFETMAVDFGVPLEVNLPPENVQFLDENDSYIICEDANGGIECAMHGHLGVNGARGSAASFAKMGRKANVGHSHSAGILDGIYTSGTSSVLNLGYARGPGSWSQTHTLTYPNGKRTLLTIWHGKAWASMDPVFSYEP